MDVIVTHHNADLDALASLIAARKLYPDAVLLRGRALSQSVKRYLALHKDHFPLVSYRDVEAADVDRVVVVDVRDRRRLKEYSELLDHAEEIVVFDHHPATPHDVEADEETVEPVGACATLLCERIREEGLTLTPTEATLVLLGIYADTGQLTYSSTHPRDVDTAGWLLRQDANLRMVARYLQDQFSPGQRRLLVELIETTEELSVDAVEIAIGTAIMEDYVRSASLAVQRVMQLGGHDAMVAAIAFEGNHRVQLIARSRVSYVDVGELMREFGGGGHSGAAAATIKDRALDEVVEELRRRLAGEDFRPTRVADIMSSPVQTLPHDTTVREAQELLERFGISGVPVLREGVLDGVISRRDLQKAIRGGRDHLPISSCMSHQVQSIDPEEPVEDALEMMTEADIGRMPVLADDRLIGIVTRTDLIDRLYSRRNVMA
jgi:tRNA nucleotidyltransferase (CCA-adding enzyme)